jgi:hypothetical protein
MKTIFLFIASFCGAQLFAQGNFAGAWKSLVGKTFKNENQILALKTFTAKGGNLLTDIDDEERISCSSFSKGTTVVVLFQKILKDESIEILEVIEVNNVLKTQEVKVGECRDGDSDNVGIIALVNQTKAERWQAVKTWYFNRDKIRIEPFLSKNVTCWGMVGDD